MAVGPIRYEDTAANAAEIAGFQAALADQGGSFADAFMPVPSPGIVALALKNAYYPDDEACLADVAAALQVEYRAALAAGLTLPYQAPPLPRDRPPNAATPPVAHSLPLLD